MDGIPLNELSVGGERRERCGANLGYPIDSLYIPYSMGSQLELLGVFEPSNRMVMLMQLKLAIFIWG